MPLEPIPFGISWAARDPFGYGGFTPPEATPGELAIDGDLVEIDAESIVITEE